jgi:hypothetical protein
MPLRGFVQTKLSRHLFWEGLIKEKKRGTTARRRALQTPSTSDAKRQEERETRRKENPNAAQQRPTPMQKAPQEE